MPSLGDIQFIDLQRCNFHQLTAYRSTGERVIHGSKEYFEDIVQRVAQDPKNSDETVEILSPFDSLRSSFNVRLSLEGIADYSHASVTQQFPTLKSSLLPDLINAHLHEHFLREHPALVVIDPIEDSRSNLFRQEMTSLANVIATCPLSPVPRSCPAGIGRCTPCKSGSVTRYRSLANIPHNAYIFGAIPHPLTYLSYIHQKSELSPRLVIDTRREEWVLSVTADMMGKHNGGYQRIQMLKDFIRSDSSAVSDLKEPSGFWQIWEEIDLGGLPSILGFTVDINKINLASKSSADSNSVALTAREHVLSPAPDSMRDMVESWNLAWSELWYFVRAGQWHRISEQLDMMGSFAF